jgi:putative ABC transport system substrate-binding protein
MLLSPHTRRREVVAGLAAVLLPARDADAQPSLPVIGFLHSSSPGPYKHVVSGFLAGLNDRGIVIGRDAALEYRWAEGRYERLPALASELVELRVAVLAATGGLATALAAKAATQSVPVIFTGADDPIGAGLVASFSRPGGNITGVTAYTSVLRGKRMEFLFELVPSARRIAVLNNPSNPGAKQAIEEAQAEARANGREALILQASDENEFDAAFSKLRNSRAGALLVNNDPYFTSRRAALVRLTAEHRVPAMYQFREFVVEGGLISYGTDIAAVYRQAGAYAARMLKGEKPTDLPVLQPTKVELVLNLKTARALGLTVPLTLQAQADEVIE